MRTIRIVLLVLPWIIIVGLVMWLKFDSSAPQETINSTAVLKEIEPLGKLELVKYNFQEITELKELSKKYFQIFQLGPDSKIALISHGQAVGCIDLTKLKESDINLDDDTLFIKLPDPEICYYKLDMDKTRIYSLQTNPLKDEKTFIQKAYKTAEKEIEQSAINSGILTQTKVNAHLMLKPMLEKISGKKVVFVEPLKNESIKLE